MLLALPQAFAGDGRTTLYLDGARVELTVAARKGIATAPLPPDFVKGSLRVAPVGRSVIDRVSLLAPSAPRDADRERRALEERRDALEDRLAALAVKEKVFTSAAKSQSGRAPKRTKTNPEPLATIRQGTDYAVAQLEAVYRGRRIAERELARVRQRLAVIAGDPAAVGSVARVALREGERVRISYLVRDRKWTPIYELHLNGDGRARLLMRTDLPAAAVVPAPLAAGDAVALPVDPRGVVRELECQSRQETVAAAAQGTVRAQIVCSGAPKLPPGDAACYAGGVYMGEIPRFAPATDLPVMVECGVFGPNGTAAGDKKHE